MPRQPSLKTLRQRRLFKGSEWLPKGVHFGWERSFKNKGKFPATIDKEAARQLVRSLLETAPLSVYPNCREGRTATDQLRVVADAGRPIDSRAQRRVRIVIIRDEQGFVVDNAFPVRLG